jgi:hypothetical protein
METCGAFRCETAPLARTLAPPQQTQMHAACVRAPPRHTRARAREATAVRSAPGGGGCAAIGTRESERALSFSARAAPRAHFPSCCARACAPDATSWPACGTPSSARRPWPSWTRCGAQGAAHKSARRASAHERARKEKRTRTRAEKELSLSPRERCLVAPRGSRRTPGWRSSPCCRRRRGAAPPCLRAGGLRRGRGCFGAVSARAAAPMRKRAARARPRARVTTPPRWTRPRAHDAAQQDGGAQRRSV